ncbi:MAG: tol-pal system YbgF family protein [Planctomycetota bacterium]
MFASLLVAGLALLQSGEIQKQPTAAAQLNYAKKVKGEARGTKGAGRIQALDRAILAYEAVANYWPDGGAILGEAAFRRGEIQRTLGRSGLARGAFQEAFDGGKGTVYASRALLELGHLHRRAGEFGQALKEYQKVAGLPNVRLRYLNDSREWIGKVEFKLGEWEKAAQAFAAWAANAESPVEVVRAADLEAQALLGAGKIDQADARIEKVRLDLGPLATEPTKEGAQLQKALERMKSPELIQLARAAKAASTAPATS